MTYQGIACAFKAAIRLNPTLPPPKLIGQGHLTELFIPVPQNLKINNFFFLRRNLAAKGISRSCFILVPQNLKKKKRKASEGVGLPSPPCIQENTFYIREHILRKASDGVGLPSPPATCPKFCKVSALVHLPYTSVSKET